MYPSHKLILLLLMFTGFQLGSQTILNGDFENHTADDCNYNISNSNYSLMMNASNGFGAGGELDIRGDICGDIPQNGHWYVGLNTKNTSLKVDEISLTLSTPLEFGENYTISFYDQGTSDSLRIGVSQDSLSFGQLLYTTQPLWAVWTYRSFSFIANDASKFICFGNKGDQAGYNAIDNIQIQQTSSINYDNAQAIKIYPNPVHDFLTIKSSSIKELILTNQFGNKLNLDISKRANKCLIDMSKMNSGLYTLIVKTNEKLIIEKIMKI